MGDENKGDAEFLLKFLQLELHLFANRASGWCLTCKMPLREGSAIVGLIGISRDLQQPDGRHPGYARLRRVLDHMERQVRALRDLTMHPTNPMQCIVLLALAVIDAPAMMPVSLLMTLTPSFYAAARRQLHQRGLLRCDWLAALQSPQNR